MCISVCWCLCVYDCVLLFGIFTLLRGDDAFSNVIGKIVIVFAPILCMVVIDTGVCTDVACHVL